jgi:hypothetical protein
METNKKIITLSVHEPKQTHQLQSKEFKANDDDDELKQKVGEIAES